MRIAIFQTNLRIGGIQRSLLSFLGSDLLNDHEVDLFLFDRQADYDLSGVSDNVTTRYLTRFPKAFRIIPFRIAFAHTMHEGKGIEGKYDLAIDYDGYSPETACYTLLCDAKRKIIWAHSDYCERAKYDLKFNLMLWAFKSKFAAFDEVVAVSDGVAESLHGFMRGDRKAIRVIPNLVSEQEISTKAKEPVGFDVDESKVNIICVGRLDFTKNPEGALREFASAAQVNPLITLYFLGKGPLMDKVSKEASALGVADRVTFLGAKANPYPYMAKMDALLLGSRYEGQGIVLREGQALGLKLVFPKRLEKYNAGLNGTSSVCKSLSQLTKKEAALSRGVLASYNKNVKTQLSSLLFGTM